MRLVLETKDIPDFDVLTAGFPCQSFSVGGKQKGFNDNRGVLFFEVARVIDTKRPKVIFLENVENLVEHDKGRTFLVIYNILAGCGYTVRYKVMPSNEYGDVPQARKRIYLVAFLEMEQSDGFRFPEPVPLEQTIADIVKREERQKDIYYYDKAAPLGGKIYNFIGDSQNLFRVYNGSIRNLRNPRTCPTLTAAMNTPYNAVVLLDNFGVRRLTLRETLDFQGFRSDYYFPKTVNIKDAYRQVGNSVSVPVVERIAREILTTFG